MNPNRLLFWLVWLWENWSSTLLRKFSAIISHMFDSSIKYRGHWENAGFNSSPGSRCPSCLPQGALGQGGGGKDEGGGGESSNRPKVHTREFQQHKPTPFLHESPLNTVDTRCTGHAGDMQINLLNILGNLPHNSRLATVLHIPVAILTRHQRSRKCSWAALGWGTCRVGCNNNKKNKDW